MDEFGDQADAWIATILKALRTPFPWGSGHTATGPDDCDVTPQRLHPAFHGCLDWHSSVHMQWSAITLLGGAWTGLDPGVRDEVIAELNSRLTPTNAQIEADYLAARPGYERPYGWGWAALLAAAARANADDPSSPIHEPAQHWAEATAVVADQVATNLLSWLPTLAYPVRHGTHTNTAFALALAHDGFAALERDDVVAAIDHATRTWFLDDVDYPSDWEPSGADFLSPALTEADLARRILTEPEFATWLNAFLPGLAEPGDRLLAIPTVLDPTDGHAVHLYGLALSRAAMLRAIAPALDRVRAERAFEAAKAQIEAVNDVVTAGDYMSTHWLVSFALLAALS